MWSKASPGQQTSDQSETNIAKCNRFSSGTLSGRPHLDLALEARSSPKKFATAFICCALWLGINIGTCRDRSLHLEAINMHGIGAVWEPEAPDRSQR